MNRHTTKQNTTITAMTLAMYAVWVPASGASSPESAMSVQVGVAMVDLCSGLEGSCLVSSFLVVRCRPKEKSTKIGDM